MANAHQQGEFIQEDFFDNTGGLNLADSPFRILENQAVAGSYNYDYTATGGIKKRNGNTQANGSADAQLKSLGLGIFNPSSSATKTIIRAAGTKIQSVNANTYVSTNLVEDTVAAGSDFLTGGSTQQVVMSQFNTSSVNALWAAGGGMSTVYGYNGTKITKNGAAVATGSIALSQAPGGGTFGATGTYWYAIVLHKASTGVTSNAALDTSIALGATTNTITINLSGITGLDTTKYDQVWIYRSALNGATGFTTGDLIAQVTSSTTTYADTGTFISSSVNVPRSGNTVLDNSALPTGTFKTLATWKRRLVTANGSTLYISDLNKAESWPLTNTIQIPSGGDITGISIISFATPTTTGIDELLVIFKERELWILSGSSYTDWVLKFIDYTGCPNQTLVVAANGFLSWMDYRGVYLWDGSAKPIYCSRPIEFLFGPDGDLDRSKLPLGVGAFYRKQNEIVWYLSSSFYGEQVLGLKLDLRLTLPQVQSNIGGRILEGVFIQDTLPSPVYAVSSTNATFDEILLSGDGAGLMWKMFDNQTGDAATGVAFSYQTKPLDLGRITQTKRFQKIIVWCRDTSSNNLTLNFWVNYRTDTGSQSTQAQPISSAVTDSLWDAASWDAAYWDKNLNTFSPVVFNLNSAQGGTEGEALTLQFVQKEANVPVTIAGFSVIYTLAGLRK